MIYWNEKINKIYNVETTEANIYIVTEFRNANECASIELTKDEFYSFIERLEVAGWKKR